MMQFTLLIEEGNADELPMESISFLKMSLEPPISLYRAGESLM